MPSSDRRSRTGTGPAAEHRSKGATLPDEVLPESASSPEREPLRQRTRSGLWLQDDWGYLRRLLVAAAVVGIAYFLWLASSVLLLAFAAVLIAVLLSSLANFIARHLAIAHRWALTLATVMVAALMAGFLILFGSAVAGQIAGLADKLPEAINASGSRIGIEHAFTKLRESISQETGSSVLSRVAGFGFTVLGAAVNIVLVLAAAIYLAADPALYRRGTVKLLPPSQHARLFDAMDVTANALRLWFAGQVVTMTLVGTVSGLAYWWIGLPSPVALGIIAAITNFIPFLGPFLGAVPPLIFALAIDLQTVVWTVGAIFLIQQLEGNVITPIVQRWAVSMPPALALFAIVVFGIVFGIPGILLAAPLTVALIVLVKKLWIRQTLGEATPVPGEDDQSAGEAG